MPFSAPDKQHPDSAAAAVKSRLDAGSIVFGQPRRTGLVFVQGHMHLKVFGRHLVVAVVQ